MKQTGALWSAVRLLAFANLPLRRKNWESFWPSRLPPPVHGRASMVVGLPGVGVVVNWLRPLNPEFRFLRLPVSMPAEEFSRRAQDAKQEARELWFAFMQGVARYGTYSEEDVQALSREAFKQEHAARMRRRHFASFDPAGADWMYEWPLRVWPHWDADGRPITFAAFSALHRRTRARLAAICEDRDVGALLLELEQYRTPARAFFFQPKRVVWCKHGDSLVSAWYDHAGSPVPWSRWRRLSPYEHHRSARQRTERPRRGLLRHEDAVASLVTDAREPLSTQVDGLFVRTKLAGLWRDFYRCAGCGGFLVKRLHGQRVSRYCSTVCRARAHRQGGHVAEHHRGVGREKGRGRRG